MDVHIPKGQKEISDKVKEVSEGIVARAVDLLLVSIFYGFEFGVGGYGEYARAGERTSDALSEFNYSTIKRSIRSLRTKGFIRTFRSTSEYSKIPTITEEGKHKLKELVPQYRKKRTWDGRIYLVTYDLPRKLNRDRNRLRKHLKKIGCGMLQYSVWITPYSPIVLVREFVEIYGLGEMILVSTLQKEGSVGSMDLSELIETVYKLDDLNGRYSEFILKYNGNKITKEHAIFAYLSILRDDPQLPFELLPLNWQGDNAYKLYSKMLK